MPIIEILEINEQGEPFTVDEFLSLIRPSHPHWWSDGERDMRWGFRGHWNADWLLQASAVREEKNYNLQSLIDKCRGENDQLCEAEIMGRCEVIALYQFAKIANTFGIPIPEIMITFEGNAFENNRILSWDEPNDHRTLNSIAALAQHHGIPTRLLDWTLNPMYAAYFAVARQYRKGESDECCVWAVNQDNLANYKLVKSTGDGSETFNLRPAVINLPAYSNYYLQAQHGLFTSIVAPPTFGEFDSFFSKYNKWPDLEHIISNVVEFENTPVLRKIILQASKADELLFLLDREGINQVKLMPTLDKAAETVMDRWVL